MGLAHNPRIVTSGLVLYLDAANPRSYPGTGTTWFDLSGNNNHGTLVNGIGYNSDNNGKLIFDGVDDTVTTSLVRPSPTTEPTTYELVFKYNSTATFRGLIGASIYNASGFSVGFIGNSSMRITYNANAQNAEQQFTFDSSTIVHGVFIFDGRDRKVYRNTELVHSSVAAFDVLQNNSGIRIAGNLQGGWSVPQADIFLSKVYNRALSEQEIKLNFNALRGRYGL